MEVESQQPRARPALHKQPSVPKSPAAAKAQSSINSFFPRSPAAATTTATATVTPTAASTPSAAAAAARPAAQNGKSAAAVRASLAAAQRNGGRASAAPPSDSDLAALERETLAALYPSGSAPPAPLAAPHGLLLPFPIMHEDERELFARILLPPSKPAGHPAYSPFELDYNELDSWIAQVEAEIETEVRDAGIDMQ